MRLAAARPCSRRTWPTDSTRRPWPLLLVDDRAAQRGRGSSSLVKKWCSVEAFAFLTQVPDPAPGYTETGSWTRRARIEAYRFVSIRLIWVTSLIWEVRIDVATAIAWALDPSACSVLAMAIAPW